MRSIRNELGKLIKQKGLSQSTVAKALGISGSALSQYLSGKYPGDKESIDKKAAGYLQLMKERTANRKRQIPFIETSISSMMWEVIRTCHIDGEMGVAYGEAGIGKTWAVREYARQNHDTILIEVHPGSAGKIPFTRTLHKAVGGDGIGRVPEMFDYILERLKESGRMLIIDEAEHLPYRTLELLRRVHDFTEIGVLMVGMEQLVRNLRGRKRQFTQLYSRISVPCAFEPLSEEDTAQVVQAVIPNANGLAKVFHDNCENSLRILRTLLFRSIRAANINQVDLSASVIRQVRKTMIA
jgi:DNA transposition AAA+ family ATPase